MGSLVAFQAFLKAVLPTSALSWLYAMCQQGENAISYVPVFSCINISPLPFQEAQGCSRIHLAEKPLTAVRHAGIFSHSEVGLYLSYSTTTDGLVHLFIPLAHFKIGI